MLMLTADLPDVMVVDKKAGGTGMVSLPFSSKLIPDAADLVGGDLRRRCM